MESRRWCVHFSDGTRLEVEAGRFTQQTDGSIRFDVYLGEVGGSVKEVLRAAPGEWRYFHAVGEDGCGAVNSAKERMTAKGKTRIGQERKP